MSADISAVLRGLDEDSREALEKAALFGKQHAHFEITPDHLLLILLDDAQSIAVARPRAAGVEPLNWIRILLDRVKGLETGNPGNPAFAAALLNWLGDCVDAGAPALAAVDRLFEKMLERRESLGFAGLPGIDLLDSAPPAGMDFDASADTSAQATGADEDEGTPLAKIALKKRKPTD